MPQRPRASLRHRGWRCVTILALLSVLQPAPVPAAAATTAGHTQQSPNRPTQSGEWPRFERAVEVVRVQAIVSDDDGEFVSGLGVDDFSLLLDGDPRPVIDVLEMSAGRLVEGGRVADEARGRPGDPLPFGSYRQFVLFLDLTERNSAAFRNARSAAKDFIEEVLQPEDRLALALYGAYSGLIMAVPFTTEHERVAGVLDTMSGGTLTYGLEALGEPIPVGDVGANYTWATADLQEEIDRTMYTLDAEAMTVAFRELAETLRAQQGRKHVLFFSRGLADLVFNSASFIRSLEEATEAMRSADAVVYPLQPDIMRGITAHDPGNAQSTWVPGQSSVVTLGNRGVLQTLAADTGGEAFFFRHRLRSGLRAIEEATRDYYVITFQVRGDDPPDPAIEVAVSRSGLVVDAPKRLGLLTAFANLSPMQRAMRLNAALELGEGRNDMAVDVAGLRLPSVGDRARMALLLQVPGSELAALAGERGDGSVQMEILGLALGAGGEIVDVIQGRAAADDITGVEGVAPLRYVGEVRVPPGYFHVKVLVRETGTDAMTVRSIRVESRDASAGGVVVAGPVPVVPASVGRYLWAERPASASGATDGGASSEYPLRLLDTDLAPDLNDVVVPGATREFFVRVEGLELHPFNRNVEWSMRTEVIGTGNRVVTIEDPEFVLFDDADPRALRILLRVPFGYDLAPGPNELNIRVLDRFTGAVAEGRWDFTVLPR